MFEDSDGKNSLVESIGALVYLIKANPVRLLIYCGAIPFAVLWIVHDTRWNAFLLQAYFVTTFVFAYEPFRNKKQAVTEWRFWKGMLLGGIAIHPLVLAGIYYLDVSNSSFVESGATLFLVIFVASVLESIVLKSVASRFQPPE
jgi:hypothetical protein